MFYPIRSLFLVLVFTTSLQAYPYVGGELHYSTNGSTIVTLNYYAYADSNEFEGEGFQICFSDGACTQLTQAESVVASRYNLFQYRYTIAYDFLNYGEHRVWVVDPNLPEGLCNLNFPNSGTIPFFTEIRFDLQEGVANSSPLFYEPPFITTEVEESSTYHPIPIDEEGHRLAYQLVVTGQDVDTPVPNYQFPDQISPSADNSYTLNGFTGLFTWTSPQVTCGYWLTFEVEEYSVNGTWLSTTMRSVWVDVQEQDNALPQILSDPASITATNLPTTLVVDVESNDADQEVLLEAYSELLQNGAASFTAPQDFEPGPVTGQFTLAAGEDLERPYPYYLILRAMDDVSEDEPGVTFEVVKLALGELLSASGPLRATIELNLSPNPATDFLNVGWNKDLTEGARLEVWQTDGRIVLHQPLDPGQRALELPVSEWPRGMYWLVVRSSEGWLSQPFVKQ
ncbi:MAG: T9SS type A sorting domain-containing protein [Bacteroidota bacterium]